MWVPLNPRSTDAAKAPGVGSPAGPKPVRVLDAATFGSFGRLRSTGFPVTQCFHRAAAIGLEPSRTPHFEDRFASGRPPPSTLSVGYATSPPASRRTRCSSTAVEPWRPSPVGEKRSVRSALLGLRRDARSHHDSHATRLLRGVGTQSQTVRHLGEVASSNAMPGCRGGAFEKTPPRVAGWSRAKRAIGHRGDVRCRARVATRTAAPTCSRFNSGRLADHHPQLERTEIRSPRESLPTHRNPATNRRTTPNETITGRTHNRHHAPTGVRVFSNGSETLPSLCCLTRNQQLPPQQVRSLLPAPVHPRRGIEDDPFTVTVKATNEPEEPNDDTRPTRRRIVTQNQP
jgi:hypothetical protein